MAYGNGVRNVPSRVVTETCQGKRKVRFCRQTDSYGYFFVLNPEEDKQVYHESLPFKVAREDLEYPGQSLSGLVHLLLEWVSSSSNI